MVVLSIALLGILVWKMIQRKKEKRNQDSRAYWKEYTQLLIWSAMTASPAETSPAEGSAADEFAAVPFVPGMHRWIHRPGFQKYVLAQVSLARPQLADVDAQRLERLIRYFPWW